VTAQITEIEQVVTPVDTDSGDHDLLAHYVKKEALEKAIFDGVPTLALCGKLWLPTKDALRYPICPECKEKWETLP
jgi:hypothetical protein